MEQRKTLCQNIIGSPLPGIGEGVESGGDGAPGDRYALGSPVVPEVYRMNAA